MKAALFPEKLKRGDEIRVISPSQSMAIVSDQVREYAMKRLEEDFGFCITFSKNISEVNYAKSSSIASRIEDIHDAFEDKNVKGILTTLGGFNSNQLLSHLDYDFIQANPKVFCGYSDITALTNALYAKTGLVTYSGPHFSSFGMVQGLDYTVESFKKCLLQNDPFVTCPAKEWSNDPWYINQDNRTFIPSDGYWTLNEGYGEGAIIGGNQCTFNLLHGTEYLPKLEGSILFIEDDDEAHAATIDRDLQSIIHQSGFEGVQGIVIGRFQPTMKISRETLQSIISNKKELNRLPVIGNVDFGHTTPIITFPVGGSAKLDVSSEKVTLEIQQH